jgi:hypothetical protein
MHELIETFRGWQTDNVIATSLARANDQMDPASN